MMKRTTKIAICCLVLVFALGLVGCSTDKSSGGDANGGADTGANSENSSASGMPKDSTDISNLGLEQGVVFSGFEAKLDTFASSTIPLTGSPDKYRVITVTYTNYTDGAVTIALERWTLKTAAGKVLTPVPAASGEKGFIAQSVKVGAGKSITGSIAFVPESATQAWSTSPDTIQYSVPGKSDTIATWLIYGYGIAPTVPDQP